MEIALLYFDNCPNWRIVEGHLSALTKEGLDATITYQPIDSRESAIEHGFRGSPTVLIDGIDPFTPGDAPVGLTCRIYDTDSGPAGSPTLEQLRAATTARKET
jgi:hypothetical protein